MDLPTILATIAAMPDAVSRAQEYEDLCFDGEMLLKEGRSAAATEIFEALAALDAGDDLLGHAVHIARRHLEDLGQRPGPNFKRIMRRFELRFAKLPEGPRLLAIAKSLVRQYPDRQAAVQLALGLVANAEALGPLGRKEQRFAAELRQAASGSKSAQGGT